MQIKQTVTKKPDSPFDHDIICKKKKLVYAVQGIWHYAEEDRRIK